MIYGSSLDPQREEKKRYNGQLCTECIKQIKEGQPTYKFMRAYYQCGLAKKCPGRLKRPAWKAEGFWIPLLFFSTY